MRWIKSIAVLMVVFILLVTMDSTILNSAGEVDNDDNSIVDEEVFPHNEVVDVHIKIDEEVYNNMNENAMAEEIVMADIIYNGYSIDNVGIRPKGNSSLKSVANSESIRYSFKVDLDYYIDEQSLFGITKLNFNNLFSDSTMMAEYIGYDMLAELDADASRATYMALHINGEYFGLYLCVEQVNETFLLDHFGNANGKLYKPDVGAGSDLKYISDDSGDYSGMVPENLSSYSNKDLIELMKVIEEGGDLESVLNVDSFLKYLAMSAITVHMDSYQSGMFHNYYLYNNNGIFEWITWDLNMIFNTFPRSGLSDEEATQFLIDEPVIGAMENYPLINAIFKNEDYVERYHNYINVLVNGYLSEDNITDRILSTYEMIKDYVNVDPTAFFTYEEFETALFEDTNKQFSLLNFISRRNENIEKQLSGEIESTNSGLGNSGTARGMGLPSMEEKADRPNVDGNAPKMNDNAPKMNDKRGVKGNQNKDRAGMMEGLPPGINIEDLPEELQAYIERGVMPPMEKMEEFMDELPEEMVRAIMKQMPGGMAPIGEGQQGMQDIDTSQLTTNLIILLLGIVGTLGFTYYLRKH